MVIPFWKVWGLWMVVFYVRYREVGIGVSIMGPGPDVMVLVC